MSIKQIFTPILGRDFPLAHVEESDGRLVIRQSNGPALRNFRNTFLTFGGSAVSFLVYYALFPKAVHDWFHGMSASGSPVGPLVFLCFPIVAMVFQSVNRLFGKETFVFDRNQGVFIRNGYTVGPLRNIRAVTAQITGGAQGQYPMFRLILELPRCETVTIVRTHDIPNEREFRLSGNGFSDPNKRFAMFTPWLDYDEQNLVPFLPQEIVELREKILQYVGEQAKC